MITNIKKTDLIPACIVPTTDPPPISSARWTIGPQIDRRCLSQVYEDGILRPDIVVYTGSYKRAIQRAQKALIEVYFSKHTQLIVNGVLMAYIRGEWQDIALIDFNPDYEPKQKPRNRSLL